jgi:hypothetical protein
MGTCPTWAQASSTASACAALTRPGTDTAAIRRSSSWTPTPRPWRATSAIATEVFGYAEGDPFGPANTGDSAPYVPRSVVANPYFDWADDRHPRTPWHKTVIYEAHVKALTARHPDVPPEQRGTYRGLSHPAVIDHLLSLGVTAVELMPVHHFVHERQLVDRGLTNAWGYNTLSYFAPHGGYASQTQRSEPLTEFKQDGAGTAPGRHRGHPRRGLQPHRRGRPWRPHLSRSAASTTPPTTASAPTTGTHYMNFTGCGNSLNMGNHHVLQLIMDSLATGCWRCTWTASASTSPPPSPASCTTSNCCPTRSSSDHPAGPGHRDR